jgi:hypothetical protein
MLNSTLSLLRPHVVGICWRGLYFQLRLALFAALVASPQWALASGKFNQMTWSELYRIAALKGHAMPEKSTAMVSLQGFMVPLEDAQVRGREFLLVPMPMACIHVPPPPPDQVVHVELPTGESTPVRFGPLTVRGVFEVMAPGGAHKNVRFMLRAKEVLECCQ